MKILILGLIPGGIDNGKWNPHDPPLSGPCGERLATICGLSVAEWREKFDMANLLEPWDAVTSTVLWQRGEEFRISGILDNRKVIILGRIVAQALGLPARADLLIPYGNFYVCPHPSGRCRWWNSPRNVEDAKVFFRGLLAETST
jgi:hypothetical protein